ncbi:MAG: hypothetical protein J6Y39_07100 [Bacteroidaceae bacterium]|nr:hypothetical protein [Bacteroidaceae bacterium]
MFGKIVSLASTYVVGQWAATIGNYVYEASRAYLDYRLLDENSPGYHWKNGIMGFEKKKEEEDD